MVHHQFGTTTNDCRASWYLNTSLHFILSSIRPDWGHFVTARGSSMFHTSGISAAEPKSCVQRCANWCSEKIRHPSAAWLFCLLLLLGTCNFLFDVQLVDPVCHLLGHASRPMAVHHKCCLACFVSSCCLTLTVSCLMCNLWILYVTYLAFWANQWLYITAWKQPSRVIAIHKGALAWVSLITLATAWGSFL